MPCLFGTRWGMHLESLIFAFFLRLCLMPSAHGSDKSILLQFKSSVADPSGLLSGWNSTASHHCSWFGVSCNSKFRVLSLNITGGGRRSNGSEGNSAEALYCSQFTQFPFFGFGIGTICGGNSGKLLGKLSPVIGKLTELRVLSMPFNGFSGAIPVEIWGLKNLEVLDLEWNSVSGTLSIEIGSLTRLRVVNLGFNRFVGEIPVGLSNCSGLEVLNLAGNQVNGTIPGFLGKFSKLRGLWLSLNRFGGSIPEELGENCWSLEHLDLSGNLFVGGIPRSLGNCSKLRSLLLFSNLLEDVIPPELSRLHRLEVLDVSRNSLSGPIPGGLGRLKGLKYLSFTGNNISGGIPSILGQLFSLEVLQLSSNSLSGEIPKDLVNLRKLTVLLLNNNKLSGQIPSGLANVTSLSVFNVSFNNLSGLLQSNYNLLNCSRHLGNHFLPSCHSTSLSVSHSEMPVSGGYSHNYAASPSGSVSKKSGHHGFNPTEIASITSASAIVLVLLASVVLFLYTRKSIPRSSVGEAERREITVFTDIGVPLAFENVVQGTRNFNASNCIGNGGFGATYKAEISPGVMVAVKRLSVGRFQGFKQFDAEIKTLGRVRYQKLVTLIGYHASETEMFLIYNYLSGGNLEKFIQERSERAVDWRILHKIAIDIAHALAYLHYQCAPRILHRDVKPSNILLDNDYNAYLSDFGLARLLGNSQSHATTSVAGTFGYVAPEYAMSCRVSDKADVYSYGVVLLELISDKKVLDPSFSSFGNGFNIVNWACMLLQQGRAKEFFAAGLWDAGPRDNLVKTLRLAEMCTAETLSVRPTMKEVVQCLKRLQPPPC